MKSIARAASPRAVFAALLSLALLLPLSLLGSGCGGGAEPSAPSSSASATPRTARATVTIQWPLPDSSRLIPVASNSVRITITSTSGFRTSQVITRPATTATFDNLPPGSLLVTATAHADNAGALLPPQASGAQSVTAVLGTPFALNLTLNSTIDHLVLTPSAASVAIGQSTSLAASALDASGNLILTSGSTYRWEASDSAVGTLQPSGASATFTGQALGTATITVTETESGKSASGTVTVTSAPASPSPPPAPVPSPTPTPPVVASGAQMVAYQINAAHSGYISFGKPLTFPATPTWSLTLDGSLSYPLIVNGKIYVTAEKSSGQGVLYALDAATGKKVWGPVTIEAVLGWVGLAYDRGYVFAVTSDRWIRAFDAQTGVVKWKIDISGDSGEAEIDHPIAVNGTLYTRNEVRLKGHKSNSPALLALDETTGAELWRFVEEYGPVSPPTASPDGTGLFLSEGERVVKLNPLNGVQVWEYDSTTSGMDWFSGGGTTAACANGSLYTRLNAFGGEHSSNYIFDAQTGARQPDLGSNFYLNPIPALGTSTGYFLIDGVLQAFDIASRSSQWSFAGDGGLVSAPLLIDQTVIAASKSGVVYALDAATGSVKWQGVAGDKILPLGEGNYPDPKQQPKPLRTGLGAGEGYLVVPADNRLTVWRIVN